MSSSDTPVPASNESPPPGPSRRTGIRNIGLMGLLWLVVIAVALFPFPWWW